MIVANLPDQTNLYPELRAVPASTAPRGSAQTDPFGAYYAIVADDVDLIRSIVTTTFPFVRPYKRFFVTGDHIYVQKIDGTGNWGIRIGSDKNPILRLREGMTIERRFTTLTIILMDGQTDSGVAYRLVSSEYQPTRIELMVSTGPFITSMPEPRRGFGPRMFGETGAVASTTRRFFCDTFNPLTGVFTGFETLALGKGSATLLIRNADMTNELLLGSASFGQPPPSALGVNTLFRLYAGETLTLDLDGQIVNYMDGSGLTVFTASGTCAYDWWVSRVVTDPPVLNHFDTPF